MIVDENKNPENSYYFKYVGLQRFTLFKHQHAHVHEIEKGHHLPAALRPILPSEIKLSL